MRKLLLVIPLLFVNPARAADAGCTTGLTNQTREILRARPAPIPFETLYFKIAQLIAANMAKPDPRTERAMNEAIEYFNGLIRNDVLVSPDDFVMAMVVLRNCTGRLREFGRNLQQHLIYPWGDHTRRWHTTFGSLTPDEINTNYRPHLYAPLNRTEH